jgi:4a-hydroxytetrahydrobiopterin dehydratase
MADVLSDQEIDAALEHLTDWQREGDALVRTVKLADFAKAIQVVNRVAELAESVSHHPDIDIRYNKLTFSLSTHSEGGITGNDTSMAGQIDETVEAV